MTCAYGTDWMNHEGCPGCRAESLRLSALFEADVQAGRVDRFGYTPAEAKRRPIKQLELEMID